MTTPLDYTSQIHAFSAVAREFVQLLDARGNNVDDLFFALDDLLPRLYSAGTRLAVAAPETVYADEPAARPAVPETPPEDVEELAEPLADSLANLLADADAYHILEHYGTEENEGENYDVEERFLSNDLGVMHLILKEQLGIYGLGTPQYVEESGRGWLQSFEGIWGPQLPFMLAATNRYVYGSLTPDEELEADAEAEELDTP